MSNYSFRMTHLQIVEKANAVGTPALRVSAEDRRRVERIAKRRGVTLSELLREAVQELEKPA